MRFNPLKTPNFGCSNTMPGDPRAVEWEKQRARQGFDATDLWSFDNTFIEFLQWILPQAKPLPPDLQKNLDDLFKLYDDDRNCSPTPQDATIIAQNKTSLIMAIAQGEMEDGTPLIHPVARFVIPRLEMFRKQLKGYHEKTTISRKRTLTRVIRRLQSAAVYPKNTPKSLKGLQEFILFLPRLWT